ncbi:MAG: VWA domain-containing protein, partial [Ignavibacteriales bacterium]|nr:VWA domain-containing protein [Ignavibacteriales bacterium]
NVTARLNHPFVKVYEEERELTVLLLVDLSGSQYFGSQSSLKRDIAVELSAILAFSAMKNNDKVGALLFTDRIERFIPPRKGRTHALRIVRELLSFDPVSPNTSLTTALEYLNRVQKKRAIVFLISDFVDAGYEQALRIAGKRHDLVGVVLLDPRERELPPFGLVAFHDGETGHEQWVDTMDPAVRSAHTASWTSMHRSRQAVFRKSKLDAVEISIDRSYMKPLTDFFQRRERRW